MLSMKNARRRKIDDDEIAREMAFHLNELIDANLKRGMNREEARRQALLEFGGEEQIKQQVREIHASAILEMMKNNLRAALRFVRRSPSFSLAVIFTLALGIGANSAVFSAIDAILLRPLPFPHSEELVSLRQNDFKNKSPEQELAPVRLEDWSRLNKTFQAITGYYTEDVSETSGELPEKLTEANVASRFLQVWGVSPELGRDFTPMEERYGGPHAMLISDRFWQRRFHADPSVLGKTLRVNGFSYSIVGVLPPSFHFGDVDLWEPNPSGSPWGQSRESTWFLAQGRLKPGITFAEARADLDAVQKQLGKQFPKTDADLAVEMKPLKQEAVGDSSSSLWLLFGSVSLLLLIACTNIAALLLARATEREYEVAIRFSLGASRWAVLSQLLTEVFVLALAGSLMGLLLAAEASHFFAFFTEDLPRVDEITLNWRIVAYSLGCALLTTLVSGLFPALRATRRDLLHSLGQSSRTQVVGSNRMQWTLVGMQVALAVTLLIGAGLLLRSFQIMGRVYPGFESAHVLTLRVSGSWNETGDSKKLAQRIERTLNVLRAVPGVKAAATASFLPGVPVDYQAELNIAEGQQDPNRKVMADPRYVSAGYFATMQIPMLQGEPCREELPYGTAVVNRSFEKTYFPNDDAIGHHLAMASGVPVASAFEIRGVASDAKEEGLNREPAPTMYWCISAPSADPYYLIRVHGDPAAMADTLRRAINKLEPARSVYDVMPLDQHLSDAFAENRLRTLLLALFAMTAVALVSIGIYGTISYMGRIRKREIGLRLALGAMPGQIVTRFLVQSLRVAGLGCVVGIVLGLGMSRLLQGMLYGVSSADVATYGGVIALILFVTALAALIPAIRAANVEPTRVLREE
jgi:putative ABC transport system permease protein